MITREEIEQKSDEFEIHTSNLQRDYVFGWLLMGIYTVSNLKDLLVLKGGNAFRKAYFSTTRFSGDLDFSAETAINPQTLLDELNRVCDFVQEVAGVVFEKERNKAAPKQLVDQERQVYQAKLYFRDFYGNPDTIIISVRLDVTEFDKLYLPATARNLIHPYSDNRECSAEIKCLQLEELLAIKLKCLLQRHHAPDLFDFVYSVFINREVEVDRALITRVFLKRTIFEPAPGVVRGLLLGLPFELFRGAWEKYIMAPVASLFTFETAMDRFQAAVEELFGSFRTGGYRERVFCPPEIRNAIMLAASGPTLLRVEYDGVVRMVEPYALIFKRRQDGVGREYFYVYDRTGGRSGKQSTKSFFPTKITRIENTEEAFHPQWPIELSKAGEPIGNGYFARPFGGGKRTGTTPRKNRPARPGWVFTLQCNYCGRSFPRKKRSTRLNKHKDRYNNQCLGRTGTIVGQEYKQ